MRVGRGQECPRVTSVRKSGTGGFQVEKCPVKGYTPSKELLKKSLSGRAFKNSMGQARKKFKVVVYPVKPSFVSLGRS